MKFAKVTVLLLAAACLSVVTVPQANANLVMTATQTADNQGWPTVPNGVFGYMDSGPANGTLGLYDAFKLRLTGTPGTAISSFQFNFPFNGLFDDSIGVDLNGDGTIDFAMGENDVTNTPGTQPYSPWSNLADTQNLFVTITVGSAGSTGSMTYYGLEVLPSAFAVNTLSNITINSLFGTSTIPGAGYVDTLNSIRVGYLNTAGGPGSGDPNISTSSFASGAAAGAAGASGGSGGAPPVATPEPGTLMLMGSGVLGMLGFRRRALLAYLKQ